MLFSQRDPRWGTKPLGNSGLNMSGWGCVVTDVAQSLNNAGYAGIDPGVLVDKLNATGGFTRDGLLLWYKVGEAFPQFHYAEHNDQRSNVEFVQGLWGRFNHWVLKTGETVSDPFYASASYPSGFKPTGVVRIASIDLAPAPTEPQRYWVVVDTAVLRLRKDSNTTSDVVKRLVFGNELKVDEERDGFLHVWNDARNDYDGWVAKAYTKVKE